MFISLCKPLGLFFLIFSLTGRTDLTDQVEAALCKFSLVSFPAYLMFSGLHVNSPCDSNFIQVKGGREVASCGAVEDKEESCISQQPMPEEYKDDPEICLHGQEKEEAGDLLFLNWTDEMHVEGEADWEWLNFLFERLISWYDLDPLIPKYGGVDYSRQAALGGDDPEEKPKSGTALNKGKKKETSSKSASNSAGASDDVEPYEPPARVKRRPGNRNIEQG